ncbi:MAG TPA: Crp/Fnr family transcriptional regulator [Sphingobacteriaceae bacterium]
MKYPTELQLLFFRKALEQFVVFTEREWDIFAGYLHVKTLKKKEYFAEAGKVCNEVGFLLRGSIRYYHVKDGVEITGYFSFENEFVSAYKSFLTQTPSTASIQAMENCQVICFTHSGLRDLFDNPLVNYKIERFGRLVAEALICCYDDRVASFVTKTPEERYMELLHSNNNILTRIPQHYVANYLGITPVSLSRIRRRILKPQHGLRQVTG